MGLPSEIHKESLQLLSVIDEKFGSHFLTGIHDIFAEDILGYELSINSGELRGGKK
jgi:hypothetical protein